MKNTISRYWLLFGLIMGCAGIQRDCSSCWASSTGADWVVVQMDLNGRPFRCWELRNVSIENEPQSDGIYWLDEHSNLVHISGLYNRVQVDGNNWNQAYRAMGLTQESCRAVREHMFTPSP